MEYTQNLVGFIERDEGIELDAFVEYAKQSGFIQIKYKERKGINPFTGKEVEYESTPIFWVIEESSKIGLLIWEESSSIGVAGELKTLKHSIERICDDLGAAFGKLVI